MILLLLYQLLGQGGAWIIQGIMNQRDYRTNESVTSRPLTAGAGVAIEMHELPRNMQRDDSRKFFERQQRLLSESLSKESGELTKKFKTSSKASSKGSFKPPEIPPQPTHPSALDPPTPAPQTRKFVFSYVSFLCELALGYSITIGLMYLITVSQFPYFYLLLMLGLMLSVSPWTISNVLMLVGCGMIIGNFFLNVQVLTFPAILVCYFSVLIFNQHHKNKLLFIIVVVVVVVWGYVVVPAVYAQFGRLNNQQAFYYIFPIFVFMIRTGLYVAYRWVKYTEYIFLQVPFFILGMQYGVMLTLTVGSIEFWYLMVFFTLQITNDRTQFMLDLVLAMWKSCDRKPKSKPARSQPMLQQSSLLLDPGAPPQPITLLRDIAVLPAHASGYACLNSLHIVCIVYVFCRLPIYSSPYTAGTTLAAYITGKQYLPVVIWALALVYEVMCLVLERNRRDKLLIGYVDNGVWNTIVRGVMLAVGLWMFYMGLGIGNYMLAR